MKVYDNGSFSFATGTSNSRTDVQTDISLNVNPAGLCLSKKVKVKTQQKGPRGMTTSSLDCTEMTDEYQSPNLPGCKDKTVSSQTFNEQQPSSLISSEQPTSEPNESGRKPCSSEMTYVSSICIINSNTNIMILFTFPQKSPCQAR